MKNRILIMIRYFIISLGATAASSFVGVYGVMIGATAVEMGWLQSTSNALSNGGQLIWGRISDITGKRVPFLIAGSVSLAILWFMMAFVDTPIGLIVVYALLSLTGAMISVNLLSLIADVEDMSTRGHFLSVINNFGSAGAIISLVFLAVYLRDASRSLIIVPFSMAAFSYVLSAVLFSMVNEKRPVARRERRHASFSDIKKNRNFFNYFIAMNTQGFFWSMAWPVFPMTIVLVMHFDLSVVAVLTSVSLSSGVLVQYLLGRKIDGLYRPPMIFANRIMLGFIPVFYAISNTVYDFLGIEVYSGIAGAIQNVVMNSYLLDIVPANRRGEFLSIINGTNGIVYLIGALAGGYLLQYMINVHGLREGLLITYMIISAGRFLSSSLFVRLRETDARRKSGGLLSLFGFKTPGMPSGGVVKPK